MKTSKKTFVSEHLGKYTIELQKITEKEFKGDIIVTDPCYYVNSEIWQSLNDMWWDYDNEPTDFCDHGLAIVRIKGRKLEFIYTQTAYGDGDYPIDWYYSGELKGRASVGVDSGRISIALLKDAKYLNMIDKSYKGIINFDNDYYPKIMGFNGIVEINNYNFVRDINVITNDYDDYEDYYS